MHNQTPMFDPVPATEKSHTTPTKRSVTWKAITPVPKNAPPPPEEHFELGKPTQKLDYKDPDGNLVCIFYRFDLPDGKKEFRPLTYCSGSNGEKEWRWQALPQPRPLYGLDRLTERPDAPVLVCEGEKATIAAAKYFPDYVAITSPNGAGSAHKADWGAVAGRDVVCWPDCDDEGRAYANDVARLALAAGAKSVRIVQLPLGFPDKWDLADPLPNDFNHNDLLVLIANAQLYVNTTQTITHENTLDDLVEKSKSDPGLPFKSEILEALARLKTEDRPQFELLRAQLKNQAKVRVTQIDTEIAKINGSDSEYESQTDILLRISGAADFFHAPDDTGYADIQINDHRETWAIRSKGFKRWLTGCYYQETGGAPNSEAIQSALNALEARAHFDAPTYDVHIRIAAYNDCIYIDLCNERWEAIEVTTEGWAIINNPPIRFRRTAGMLPLATPEKGGSVDSLKKFINSKDQDTFILLVAWLLGALRGQGPYPVLVIVGEHGAAKSTAMAVLRRLLDPNTALLRSLSRDERDLFIAANNSSILAFDNLSNMPSWISDALCRLSTGGGFSTRQLHTDGDEVLFNAMRPQILNGIDDMVTRPDLADRSIILMLKFIPEEQRQTEKDFWAAFDKAAPGILGALLDVASCGLRALPLTRLTKHPRMADFAVWATACENALGLTEGAFMAAYDSNRKGAIGDLAESDLVTGIIMKFMDGRTQWTGTATRFLEELSKEVSEATRKSKEWPSTSTALSGHIRRMTPSLRAVGIEVVFERSKDKERKRMIAVSKTDIQDAPPSASSEASAINPPTTNNGE